MDDFNQKLLTVDQVAKALNVPKSWIYERTRLGQQAIPHYKFGKYVRFDIEEIKSFFKSVENRVS